MGCVAEAAKVPKEDRDHGPVWAGTRAVLTFAAPYGKRAVLTDGVTGNTSDFGSEESRFEPWSVNQEAPHSRGFCFQDRADAALGHGGENGQMQLAMCRKAGLDPPPSALPDAGIPSGAVP